MATMRAQNPHVDTVVTAFFSQEQLLPEDIDTMDPLLLQQLGLRAARAHQGRLETQELEHEVCAKRQKVQDMLHDFSQSVVRATVISGTEIITALELDERIYEYVDTDKRVAEITGRIVPYFLAGGSSHTSLDIRAKSRWRGRYAWSGPQYRVPIVASVTGKPVVTIEEL